MEWMVVNIRCITTVFKLINLQIEKLCCIYFISLKIGRHWIYTEDRRLLCVVQLYVCVSCSCVFVCRAAVRHWTTWRPAFLCGSQFKHFLVIGLSRDSWVTVVNGLWTAGQLQNCGLVSSRAEICSGSKCPSQLQDPPSLLLTGYWVLFFHGCKAAMAWSWPLPFICWLRCEWLALYLSTCSSALMACSGMRSKVLTLADMNITGFWGVTSFSLVKIYRYFGGTCCLLRVEDGGETFLKTWQVWPWWWAIQHEGKLCNFTTSERCCSHHSASAGYTNATHILN